MKSIHVAILTILFNFSNVYAYSKIDEIKEYYDEGNFKNAQEEIDKILLDEENNIEEDKQQDNNIDPNKPYCLFFDALIKCKNNDFEKAKESLNKIVKLTEHWEQISEVYFLLAKINFIEKKYSEGLECLKKINDKISQKEINNLIEYFFKGDIDDMELNRSVCIFPNNKFIVKKWLYRQSQSSFNDQYIWLLNSFLKDNEYKKYKSCFLNRVQIRKKKDYNIALLIPFNFEQEPKNAKAYDLYNIITMAVKNFPDNEKFKIHVYDIKDSTKNLKTVLSNEEMQNMDVIINTDECALKETSRFSKENKILLYDLSSKDLNLIAGNDFAFLTKPSYGTYSLGVAKYILNDIVENKETEKKDIVVVNIDTDYKTAEIFRNYMRFNGIQVKNISLTKEELKNVLYDVRINLNTIEKNKRKKEIEEKKKLEEIDVDSEEKKKDIKIDKPLKEEVELEKLDIIKTLENSSYVYVASNDTVLLGNVIGILEQCNLNPKIFCDYDFLNGDLIEEIFNKENITYINCNNATYEDNSFLIFKENYFELFKKYPSLEMFYTYNAAQKVFEKINRLKQGILHDEQNLFFVKF